MFYNVPSFPVSKAGQQGGSADEDVCVIKALLHTLFFFKKLSYKSYFYIEW